MGYRHGESYTHLYAVWKSMRQRCQNENHHAYKNYGGRGIKVCDEWQEYLTFKAWAIESGYDPDAPRGQSTLDRIDNDGDYCPDNCRWTDMGVQSRNRRDYTIAGSVAVEQIDADGNVIGRFNSLTEAGRETNTDRHRIKRVCDGLMRQTKGTRWRYALH